MAVTPNTLLEPTAESRRTDAWKAAGVALLAGAVMFIAVVGFLTLLGVSSTQDSQGKTLTGVNNIVSGLKMGNVGVSKILVEAGTAVVALEGSQHRIEVNEYATCIAVHGLNCQPPN